VPLADDALRLRALARLPPLAPELARDALESGEVVTEPAVLAWEGSLGRLEADRVSLGVTPELAAALRARPAVVDVLTQAIAAAVAEAPGRSLAELRIEPRAPARPREGPYRGR